jgi:hypothetical protein
LVIGALFRGFFEEAEESFGFFGGMAGVGEGFGLAI